MSSIPSCSSPSSMFGRIPIARRHAWAAAYNKIIWPFLRCLRRVVASLGVSFLWLLCVFYVITEYTFTKFYLLAFSNVWKPVFPLSWRLLLMTLFIVPLIALVRVLWLSVCLLIPVCRWGCSKPGLRPSSSRGYSMLPRSEANSLEERPGGDEDRALADIEGDTGVMSSSFQQFPTTWCWWLCVWFAVLCISLSIALDFDRAGDLRYLPQIEQANAHPRREGYNNNGNTYCRGSVHSIPR